MIEHVSIPVSNVRRAKIFYAKALKPLGYRMNMDFADAAGFKADGHTSFWIGKERTVVPTHIAFRAKSKKAVEAFYAIALREGAKDNGAPGYRAYSRGYYAAFVHDEDGNNVEAVYFDTRMPAKKRRKK
ncbi:MAG TPA: VOC family protein [Candidatus Paceibacterota bacterium]|nr:VOC family protein [Candidatus Paceibacterota bacterium]